MTTDKPQKVAKDKQTKDKQMGTVKHPSSLSIGLRRKPEHDDSNANLFVIDEKEDTVQSVEVKTKVEVLGKEGEYYLVSQQDMKGYIKTKYITKHRTSSSSKPTGSSKPAGRDIEPEEYEVENITTKEDDSTVGGWFGVGMYYAVHPRFVLGLDVRYSRGEVSLFDQDRDAGGLHTYITAGLQF